MKPFVRLCLGIPPPPTKVGPQPKAAAKISWWQKIGRGENSSSEQKDQHRAFYSGAQQPVLLWLNREVAALNFSSEVTQHRFLDEVERRLTPDVKYVAGTDACEVFSGPGRVEFKNVRTGAHANCLQRLPPVPGILPLLTLEKLPNLEVLTLHAHHFSCPDDTQAFCRNPSSTELLQRVKFLSFHPTSQYTDCSCETVLPSLLGPYSMPTPQLQQVLGLFVGGALLELDLPSVSKSKSRSVFESLAGSNLPKQLERLRIGYDVNNECGKHNVPRPQLAKDGAEKWEALALVLSQASRLKELRVYCDEIPWREIYRDGTVLRPQTYTRVQSLLAQRCQSIVHLHLSNWTLYGLQMVVKSVGHQLVELTGTVARNSEGFSDPGENVSAEALTIVRIISNGCPVLERTLEEECRKARQHSCLTTLSSRLTLYHDTIRLLVTKCKKLSVTEGDDDQ